MSAESRTKKGESSDAESRTIKGESFERNSNVDEGSSSVRALPELVTGRIFMYLTDMHVRRVIMANGSDGEQLFDNMRVSRDYYDSIPKCWECWSKTELTVYTVGGRPQPRDGPCVGYCKK